MAPTDHRVERPLQGVPRSAGQPDRTGRGRLHPSTGHGGVVPPWPALPVPVSPRRTGHSPQRRWTPDRSSFLPSRRGWYVPVPAKTAARRPAGVRDGPQAAPAGAPTAFFVVVRCRSPTAAAPLSRREAGPLVAAAVDSQPSWPQTIEPGSDSVALKSRRRPPSWQARPAPVGPTSPWRRRWSARHISTPHRPSLARNEPGSNRDAAGMFGL